MGVPRRQAQHLFEMLILEGAQAGPSWRTIISKQEAYRRAFQNFNPEHMAGFGVKHREELMRNSGVVRNRLKIDAAFANARAFIKRHDQGLDFSGYLWSFVDGHTICNRWDTPADVPASTPVSEAMSRDLKQW